VSSRQSFRRVLAPTALVLTLLALSAGIAAAATAPDTTITSGPSGTVSTNNVSFTFVSSRSNSTFKCSMDGSAFTTCTSPKGYSGLADGSHTFRVKAKNGTLADKTPASRTFTVATGAPKTTIKSPCPATTTQPTLTFSFVADQSNVTFECKLDSSPWASCTSPHRVSSGAVNHQHVFKVRATNSAGDTGLPATCDYTRLG
jgi:hypothetical protein